MRMPSGHLVSEMFQICPKGRKPEGKFPLSPPGHRDYVSQLVWTLVQIKQDMLPKYNSLKLKLCFFFWMFLKDRCPKCRGLHLSPASLKKPRQQWDSQFKWKQFQTQQWPVMTWLLQPPLRQNGQVSNWTACSLFMPNEAYHEVFQRGQITVAPATVTNFSLRESNFRSQNLPLL